MKKRLSKKKAIWIGIVATLSLIIAAFCCNWIEFSGFSKGKAELYHTEISSDGLLHQPYGWDNIYGNKEIPEIWWERNPRDPKAEEKIEIAVAVGAAANNMDIWIEWTLNGKMMDSILCNHKANLKAEGITKKQYVAQFGQFEKGDEISYAICAGNDGKLERWLGVFDFTISEWETVNIKGILEEEPNSLVLEGEAGDISMKVKVGFEEEGICKIEVIPLTQEEKTAITNIKPMDKDETITKGADSLTIPKDCFEIYLNKGERELLRLKDEGLQVLTDGKTISKGRLLIESKENEGYYGFGMRYDSLNQRGKTVDIYCVNWYTQQKSESYTPVPFYFVPNTYGLYVDSTWYSRFAMDTDIPGVCAIEVNTGKNQAIPFYLFSGTNTDIAENYAQVAGKAQLPPVWAFGPWISANEWNKQSEIIEQLEKTKEYEIPTSLIVIEAWSDEDTFYIFNDAEYKTGEGNFIPRYEDFIFKGRWPDPKGMVDTLHQNGIRTMLWQIPTLKRSVETGVQSLRDQSFAVKEGYVLKNGDGTPYHLPQGTWFGGSMLVDFTNKEAAEWFLDKRKYLLEEVGIDGFKTDGGEFIWGRDVIASDGRTGGELRNAYSDAYAKAYFDYSREFTKDAITFSRSGGSAMQTHPLAWVGDQTSQEESFEAAIRATLSASMSGIPFVAWDIAGFSGDVPTSELYQRSVAQAAFSSVMQVHSETSGDPSPSRARTPWNMAERKKDPNCIETYRFFANTRMNLMPYIYTEARHSSQHSEPLMRSMAYAFPQDTQAGKYEFQYMFGRSLLVAPVTDVLTGKVEVYLPEGKWYGLFDNKPYSGGKNYQLKCKINEIPVFVKEGSIIPINTDNTGKLGSYVGNTFTSYENLSFLVYPGQGEYVWYDYVNDKEIKLYQNNNKFYSDDLSAKYICEWMGE